MLERRIRLKRVACHALFKKGAIFIIWGVVIVTVLLLGCGLNFEANEQKYECINGHIFGSSEKRKITTCDYDGFTILNDACPTCRTDVIFKLEKEDK